MLKKWWTGNEAPACDRLFVGSFVIALFAILTFVRSLKNNQHREIALLKVLYSLRAIRRKLTRPWGPVTWMWVRTNLLMWVVVEDWIVVVAGSDDGSRSTTGNIYRAIENSAYRTLLERTTEMEVELIGKCEGNSETLVKGVSTIQRCRGDELAF